LRRCLVQRLTAGSRGAQGVHSQVEAATRPHRITYLTAYACLPGNGRRVTVSVSPLWLLGIGHGKAVRPVVLQLVRPEANSALPVGLAEIAEHFPLLLDPVYAALVGAGAVLPAFPTEDQLASPTFDGRPDENARANCWATATVAPVYFLTGQYHPPDELHDYVYGEGYLGGGYQWAPKTLEWVSAQGCHLDARDDANSGALMAYAREHVDAGHPVCITIPSNWSQTAPNANGYHSVDLIGYDAPDGPQATWYAANPWGGFLQSGSRQWWQDRLCWQRAGAMWREAQTMVPTGWKDDGRTLTAPNGVPVVQGFRDWVLGHAWAPDNWPIAAEGAVAHLEVGPQRDQGSGTAQDFRFTRLLWSGPRGVFLGWVGWDYHQLRYDPTHCAGYLPPVVPPAPPAPKLYIDGQEVSAPYTIPPLTVELR
jgi:hypothetical protein